ncbi:hypothetical protein ND748_28560, partial [Frankia sp. AiPs1]|uniref:hypothetical protein n=1 Tax=Frankia sp. AiPs1 TaxID=573493 RepID=UPI002044C93B
TSQAMNEVKQLALTIGTLLSSQGAGATSSYPCGFRSGASLSYPPLRSVSNRFVLSEMNLFEQVLLFGLWALAGFVRCFFNLLGLSVWCQIASF